ncbi:MAG TPA: FG-GAP-like repeat-containing protein, partial [Bacteroidota bacterium]|nr:FG-GAP-like repeat-containing protein [Bacteroidota bacterium]
MMRPLLPFAVTILCAATLSAQTPTIDSFSPLSGPVGDVITITGSGFNSTTENNIVRFGSVKAQVITASSSSLTVRVPKGASFAPITVTDTSSAKRLTAYSPTPFAVTFSGLQTIDEASFATRVDFSTSPGASPRGIVVADIDGDGRPDIVVSNPSSGTIGIYRNISSVGGIQSNSLAARVEYSLGSTPTGIASGDLDGDGDLDLAVTDTSGAKVYVWQNASVPGTIDTASVSSYSVGTKPFGVAIADLDGDGKPDVVTANKGGNNVSILRNTSSGGSVSFAGPTNVSTGGSSAPVDLAIADVDNNGIFEPDIITANSGNNTVTVLQNIGSMSFSVVQVTASASAGVAVADYDGDGLLDVATANSGATKISVLRNSSTFGGSITFDTKTDFEAGGNPYDVLAANIEGDGKPDLVATLSALDSIVVFRNTATSGSITAGSFASMVLLAAPTGQAGIAAADVDNDGKPDLAAANPSADGFSVFRNKAVKIEIEPNNTTDSANLLVVGETVQANHESATDIDYYKFFAFAGDTLEAFVSQYGTSNAGFTLEVFDSLGQWVSLNNRWSRSQFPSGFGVHNIFPINETRTYYISIRHPDGWGPNEIGQYRLRLERFVPSRPDLSPWPGVWRVHYNSARLQLEVSPNGLTTTTYVEWGQSPSSLTNMLPGDSRSDISVWNPDVPITGLSPNQRYYHRWTATNSMGSSTSNVNSFDTPPAPIGWEILELGNLVPQYSLYGISFPSPTTGYAVGHWNGIYKTSDEGKTWFNLFPSVNMWVEGVCFSSPTVGLVVGEGGGIFKTTDGGTTWFDKRSPHYSQHLHAVRYFGSTAIAVGEGGGIMRSTDNWETWDTVRTGPHPLLDISVINTMTAFVSGEGGTILKTVDAGATWSTVPSPSGTSGNWFWGIHFLNATTGFVAGSGMNVRKTTDGGNSWSEIQDTWDSNDITFRDANNGVIVGNGGRIFRTTDGGVTWERQSGGTYSWLKAAAFIGRMVTVVGDHGIMNYFDPAAESEPNNTIIDAMPVAFRDDIEAAIQPVGDVDYYALTLEAGDTVEVSTVALDSLSVNGILELFDGGENLLLQNDDFVPGDSVQSRIVYVTPSAGTYYARYSGSSGVSTGNYKIRFRRVSLKPLIPYAGIASIHTSTSVTLAAPVVSNNVSTTVEFEYGLTLSYGSTVQALENPISDLQLTTATADLMLDAEREYHFRVKASNAAGVAYGPDVTFITSTGTTRSEIEPNNLANQGNTIFIGDTVNAFLPSTADADYYRFQAKAGDTIEVFVRAGIMPNPYSNWGDPHLLRLQITDSTNGWNLVSNDILPHPANLHSTIIANNTGIYHIRVASRNNNLNYPSAAPDTGEPQLQPTGIALNDTASYQLRLRRFEPSAPDARFDHWFALTLHDSAVMYVEVQPNGLPTTFVLQYGQSEPFTETIAYSGAPLTGVYPVGAY